MCPTWTHYMEEIFLDDEMTKIKWGNCRFTIDVRLEGYTKATESRRILVATNFYKRRPDRHVYHTTSEALFAT